MKFSGHTDFILTGDINNGDVNAPDHSIFICCNWRWCYILLCWYCCYLMPVSSEYKHTFSIPIINIHVLCPVPTATTTSTTSHISSTQNHS